MYSLFILAAHETIKPVKSVGNILFYILLAALVIAVVTICLIFTRSKTFKVRMRESMLEKKDVYDPPRVIKVYDERVKEEIKYNIRKELEAQGKEFIEYEDAREEASKEEENIEDTKV